MGLDFIIKRKKKGEAYKSDTWQDVVVGRNCYNVKEIILNNISTYNKDTQIAELTIGTLNNLLMILTNELGNINLNDKYSITDDNYIRLLSFISELSNCIYRHCIDYTFDGIEYEYILVDSY